MSLLSSFVSLPVSIGEVNENPLLLRLATMSLPAGVFLVAFGFVVKACFDSLLTFGESNSPGKFVHPDAIVAFSPGYPLKRVWTQKRSSAFALSASLT